MREIINALDFGVVEGILAGVGGITLKLIFDFLKSKLKLRGFLVLLMNAVASTLVTAVYLAIFATFTVPFLVAYSILVFLSSVFGHEFIKDALALIKRYRPEPN